MAAALLAITAAAFSSVVTAAPTFEVVDLSSHTSASVFTGNGRFAGAGTTHDGRVVFAPFKANRVGVFDPMGGSVEDKFKVYDTNLAAEGSLFYGAVSVGDGRVVFPTYNAGGVGVFDGRDDTFTIYGAGYSYSGSAFNGGGVASDGRVFMCPYGDGTMTTFDLNTNEVTRGGSVPGWVTNGWQGGSTTLDGRVVCAPSSANTVLVYSPGTDSTVGTTNTFAASSKDFNGATTLLDGRVFMAPLAGSPVGIFDPSTNEFTHDSSIFNNPPEFGGIVTSPDGRVLFQEDLSTGLSYLFDPADDSSTSVNTRYPSGSTTRAWWGAATVGNLVVFAPRHVAAVGVLEFPCGEDEHVVSGACVRCPSGQFNQAGDLSSGPDTACDAECTCARLLNKVGLSYV